MNARTALAPRHARLLALVAAVFALALMLAGCSSSSSGDSGDIQGDYGDAGDDSFAPGAEEFESGADGAAADDAPATANRAVIVTGEMYITVEDPIAAASSAASIVQASGGRVDARSETAPDDSYGGSAQLTLRIPAAALDRVVDGLRDLGTVGSFSTDSYDVTDEVTDLDARISTLRASTERIEGLLDDATSINDIVRLEDELSSRQAQLESLEARQRGLDDQVSMSTIALSLDTEPIEVVENEQPSKNFWDGLTTGWNGLVSFVSAALVAVGVMLPWLGAIALVALAIILPLRAAKSRDAKRMRAPATVTPAPAPTESAPAATTPPSKKG